MRVSAAVRRLPPWRPVQVVAPQPGLPRRVPAGTRVVVVGGGIAGCAAAVVLAERGAQVTLSEARDYVGGRAGAWSRQLADHSEQVVEHGFHAFFRQYYNLRAFLRRLDPQLGFLRPVEDYPVISRRWPAEHFAGLPTIPPLNMLGLLVRSPSLRLRGLRQMDGAAATPLLGYDPRRTYADFDEITAADYLDSLRLPDQPREMLFEVFSRSCFNHSATMSAAEMIMNFHFYFLGNPDGLLFDAVDDNYLDRLWRPVAELLAGYGADVRLGAAVTGLTPGESGWSVGIESAGQLEADHVVVAVDVPALRALFAGSPALTDRAPGLAEQVTALAPTAPYVVARYWLAGDVAADRAVFSGVAGEPTLDSITLFHRIERQSAGWAARTGGAVVELHGYAVESGLDAATLAGRMHRELTRLWPETAGLRVLDRDWRVSADAPAFGLGSERARPGVRSGVPGLSFAGDWVRMPFPAALMERAAGSGLLAANEVLAARGAAAEPVWSVRPRGLLAGRVRAGV